MAKKAENQTSGKAEDIESPTAGSPTEVKSEENPPKVEAESGGLAEIKDITAELSAQIRKGAKKEEEQKKKDEENGLIFEDDLSDDFEITETKSNKNMLAFGIAIAFALGGYAIFKHRNKTADTKDTDEQLNSGVDNSVQVDKYGMFKGR